MSTTVTETARAEPKYEYYYRDGTWNNKREVLSGDGMVETFEEIPVVDIGDIFSEKFETRMSKAKEIAEICKTVGFMYIKNHGISQDLMDEVFSMSEKYHAQPLEKTMEQYVYKSDSLRGYEIHYTQTPTGDAVKKESFMYSYNPDLDPVPPTLTQEQREMCDGVHNQWPDAMPEFKATMVKYHSELLKLSRFMMRTFSLGLGVPETYFDHLVTAPFVAIILQHYPSRVVGAADLDSLGAHSDFETFTILNQDMVGGLEILNKNGIYVPAKPIRGTFVVNVGDFLERISNGTFVSTVHRVRNTSGKERYSIPFFFSFNVHEFIPVMDIFTSPENPAKFPPRRLYDYMTERHRIQLKLHNEGVHDALTVREAPSIY